MLMLVFAAIGLLWLLCVEAKDCLDFYTRQFASIMEYLLKTDRQLKEYMDVLEEMGLTDD